MVPDGDRRHGTVSRNVICEVKRRLQWHQDIMGVFVLCHNLLDVAHRRLTSAPIEYVPECAMIRDGRSETTLVGWIQLGSVCQRYGHVVLLRRAPNEMRLSCGLRRPPRADSFKRRLGVPAVNWACQRARSLVVGRVVALRGD